MQAFVLTVRALSAAFIAVSLLHLCLGMQADAMLGVPVTAAMADDPSFDAQNRFYGVTFSLMGIVLLLASTDIKRYAPMFNATLAVLFAAGIARSISYAKTGEPAPALVAILIADLVLPPLLYFWGTALARRNLAGHPDTLGS